MATKEGSEAPVQLGFCVPIEDEEHLLEVAYRSPDYQAWDGGQVGGKPVWLDPEHMPTRITCRKCAPQGDQKPPSLRFVCQFYAPVDCDSSDRAFHRSLYVFACPTCCGVRVLRSQLPAENSYFPNHSNGQDAVEEVNWQRHLPSYWKQNLCAVCGLKGNGKCPLQGEYFCSPQHQREYKMYQRKMDENSSNNMSDNLLPSVYHMTQLVVEEESAAPGGSCNDGDREEIFENDNDGSDDDNEEEEDANEDDDDNNNEEEEDDANLEQGDLNAMTGAKTNEIISEDSVTMRFYQRIQDRPNARDQCLRYCRWVDTAPLWIRQDEQAPTEIPPCPYCQGPRRFEFQLMPQLLHYLLQGKQGEKLENLGEIKEALEQTESLVQQAPPEQVPPALVDVRDAAVKRMQDRILEKQKEEIDWGVVAVYTCVNSCNEGADTDLGSYREEFAWVQPSLDS